MYSLVILFLLGTLATIYADVITQGNGNSRLSYYGNPNLPISKIPSLTFAVDRLLGGDSTDQFYAQPIVFQGKVFLASVKNNIYQLDANTGAVLKSGNVGQPFNIFADIGSGCTDISIGLVGTLSTPVVDAGSKTIYFVSKSYKAGTTGGRNNAIFRLHAIDFHTWTTRPGFPVMISGNNGKGTTFDAGVQLQRTALHLQDGKIFIAFGSHCDFFTYHGWLISVDKTSGSILNRYALAGQTSSEYGASIWHGGMGLSSRTAGSLFAVTGNAFNAPVEPPSPGSGAASRTLQNSVVRFSTSSVQPFDFFTPSNTQQLDDDDLDLGGTGILQLPVSSFGTSAHPQIGALAGKDGFLYVVDTNNLGGFKQGSGGGNNIIQKLKIGNGEIRGSGATFPPGKRIYYSSHGEAVKSFLYNSASGTFTISGQTAKTFGNRSGSPAITSMGSSDAVLWMYDSIGGILYAWNAIPSGGTLAQIATFPVNGCKFASPTFNGGKVYIATCDGRFKMLK